VKSKVAFSGEYLAKMIQKADFCYYDPKKLLFMLHSENLYSPEKN